MSGLPGKLDPIKTGRLAGGLLAVARPLPADYDVWRQGINFNPACNKEDINNALGCVDPADADDKNVKPIGDPVIFNPFLLYNGRSCSTWMDAEELLMLARQGQEGTISSTYAQQLQSASVGPDSPSLNSTAIDITPVTPSDVVNTISGLVQELACTCGIGGDIVLHVNLRAIPFLVERHLVEWEDSTGQWMYGPYPISADCYGTTGPGDVEEAEDGSTVWIYATGPVEVATSPELDLDGLDVATNVRLEVVERLGILRFDPCCVYAAQAVLF